nr:hypothetical protein StreXyl84_32800 [Streptomyces sp. Xyl84]
MGNAARGGRPPRRFPDPIGLSPLQDGLSGKLPSREGTRAARQGSPVSRETHQSPRDEELDMNFRTM